MKLAVALISLMSVVSVSAHAAEPCKDLKFIAKAALRAFSKTDRPYSASASGVSFTRTTKTGKDQWMVEATVNEECNTSVIVYTRAGTCTLVGEPFEIPNGRDCG